jgi:phenylpropionate dioxygenase-like ring-hydroxylating dioxygenase large terminal subunit
VVAEAAGRSAPQQPAAAGVAAAQVVSVYRQQQAGAVWLHRAEEPQAQSDLLQQPVPLVEGSPMV